LPKFVEETVVPPDTPLTRRRIAEEALAVIDEQGFDALTVRLLAARLGVRSPSLYNHVSGKDEILAAVTDLLGERVDLEALECPDLRQALHRFAHSYRAAFRGHPEVTALLARRPVTSDSALVLYEQLMTRLVAAGLPPRRAVQVLGALETLVLGSVVLTFTAGLQHVDAGRAPLTARSLEGADADEVDDTAFEMALDALLAGVLRG
jgi:AcrR family transcriptional regulator